VYERKRRPPKRKPEEEIQPIPARTEMEEEKRAGGLAMDLAIKQLREGTASSQIIVHFLKINSQKEQAELEKTRREIELLKAKKKAIEAGEEQDRKYEEVIKAISSYAGKDQEWEIVEDEYPEYR
jgi:hypothetical protein